MEYPRTKQTPGQPAIQQRPPGHPHHRYRPGELGLTVSPSEAGVVGVGRGVGGSNARSSWLPSSRPGVVNYVGPGVVPQHMKSKGTKRRRSASINDDEDGTSKLDGPQPSFLDQCARMPEATTNKPSTTKPAKRRRLERHECGDDVIRIIEQAPYAPSEGQDHGGMGGVRSMAVGDLFTGEEGHFDTGQFTRGPLGSLVSNEQRSDMPPLPADLVPKIIKPRNPELQQQTLKILRPSVLYVKFECEDEDCRTLGICVHFSFVLGCRFAQDGLICHRCKNGARKAYSARRRCIIHNNKTLSNFSANLPEDITASEAHRTAAKEILRRAEECDWEGVPDYRPVHRKVEESPLQASTFDAFNSRESNSRVPGSRKNSEHPESALTDIGNIQTTPIGFLTNEETEGISPSYSPLPSLPDLSDPGLFDSTGLA